MTPFTYRSITRRVVACVAITLCAANVHSQTRPFMAPGPAFVPSPTTATPHAKQPAAKPQSVQTNYDSGDPTAEEQYILELINRARARPDSEGLRLFNCTDADVTSNWDYWLGQGQAETRAQIKADFAGYPKQPPLAMNAALLQAARGHDQDMLDHNYQGHTGSDGSDPVSRCAAAGYVGSYIGENVSAYGTTPFATHMEFLVDAGPGNFGVNGHRKNIMNFDPSGPHYAEIGIGLLHGGTGIPNVGPLITTEDFGDAGQIFIVGVVYDDKNHNLFYDVGEGISGVTITVSSGSSYSAVTGTAGGYAIPIESPGNITITASGGGLTEDIVKQISVSDQNVKVDFIKDYSGFPYQPTLTSPIGDTTLRTDTAFFTWGAVAGATKYRVQASTDSNFKTFVLNDSTLTTPVRTLAGLKDSTRYYWRAQGKNAKGWGQYALTETFFVALPPKQVTLLFPANGATISPDSSFKFRWHSTPKTDVYQVEIDTLKDFSSGMINDVSLDTFYYMLFTNLEPLRTYYWRITGQNENGNGAPSAVWSFKTGPHIDAVALLSASEGAIIVSPNPANGVAHFRFTTAESSPISLRIFDLLGKQVKQIDLGMQPPNSYDIPWNTEGIPPGTYQYKLTNDHGILTGKIVLIH